MRKVSINAGCELTPYAEIRNALRAQLHAEMVGNKSIHLHEVTLREREPMEVCNCNFKGLLLFGGFFVAFTAMLTWGVTGIWP